MARTPPQGREEPDRTRAGQQLAEVLSSRVRATVLAWLAPRLDARFSLTELSQAVGAPVSSLQHECYKLERLGVLQGRREGVSRRYAIQLDHALSRPLVNLVVATLGLEAVLQEAIAEAGRFHVAALAGPDRPDGRPVLVLIGDTSLAGLDQVQRRVSLLLGLDPEWLELAYFQRDDWRDKGARGHPLLQRLANRPVQAIIGPWPPTPG
jgi:DNA-binding Lrp family transcriptional regulator